MTILISKPAQAQPGSIGQGFKVQQTAYHQFAQAAMSPFVMVDHFEMWAPTFEPHPHAGMSAVTLTFEDTRGSMLSVDSTGRSSQILPGDLHWTLAGRGIVHTQQPADGHSHVHALQIFVNLPEAQKGMAAHSFLVSRKDMPRLRSEAGEITVVAGHYAGLSSPGDWPQAMAMLEAKLQPGTPPQGITLPAGWNATVLVLTGQVRVGQAGAQPADGHNPATLVLPDQAVTASAPQGGELLLWASSPPTWWCWAGHGWTNR
jgi:hypothetical protein